MKIKQIISIVWVIALIFSFSGCKETPKLDPYIKTEPASISASSDNKQESVEPASVIDTAVETESIIESTIETTAEPTSTQPEEWPDPEIELAKKKALFEVSSDWTTSGVLTEEIYTETASLKDGGSVEIMFYYGFYQQTTLILSSNEESERIAQAKSFLKAYLGRDITDYEVFVLQTAIQDASISNDIVNISGIQGLSAYAIHYNSFIQIICN